VYSCAKIILMQAVLPLIYPLSLALVVSLNSFFGVFEFFILPILAIIPFMLTMYKKRWSHSVISVLFAFFLVGIWFVSLYLLAILSQGLGSGIDMSLNIFNTYVAPISIAGFLLMLLLSLSSKTRHYLAILRQPLFINSLLGIVVLVWFGINVASTSVGGPQETIESIPTVSPL
jgi:heme/copper-type cytochrome/quinol oxidase subunit 4